MTKEEAINQLEQDINTWYEFWDGASYVVSENTIDAIKTLIKLIKNE